MESVERSRLLEHGVAFHRKQQFSEALSSYRQVLAGRPADPDALNLAADACFSLGDFAGAAQFLDRLAAAEPQNARIRFNLGIALRTAGDPKEATRAFRRAVEIDPIYPKGWFNLGVSLYEEGDITGAAQAYEHAVAADPGDVAATANLAGALAKMREFNRALEVFDAVVERSPQDPTIRLMQAAALREIELYDRAADASRAAVSLAPDNPDAHASLALSLSLAGDHQGSIAANRRALELAPHRAASHVTLAGSLIETGAFAEALAASDAALEIDTGNQTALRNKGRALIGLARYNESVGVFENAFSIAASDADILAGYEEALTLAGREAEVDGIYEGAIATPADTPKPYTMFATRCLKAGDAKRALSIASQSLTRFPADTGSLALQAVAATATGERHIADKLLDFKRLVARVEVSAPTGWASVAEFNSALSEHILNHPSIQFAPPEHATRQGYHTGNLRLEPKGPITGFEELILSAAGDYRADHPKDDSHPFLAQAPDRFGLSIWSIILKEAGYQVPHIHPAAWLSGVYYPQLPPVIDDNDQAGWIEFGRPSELFTCGPDPDVVVIRPEEGLMLLFPSYMYHRTIPFSGDGTRISIAFDVIPVG